MEYVFHISGYDDPELERDAALALSRRVDEDARRKYPGLMKSADRLNQYAARGPGRKKRIPRYRIHGAVLLFLGVFLLLPGLASPQELAGPLTVGTLAVCTGLFFLLIPQKKRDNAPAKGFLQSAGRLLERLRAVDWSGAQVRFTEEGMDLATAQGEAHTPWREVYGLYEARQLCLLVYEDEKVLILKEEDLASGALGEFASWAREKMTVLAK